MKYRLIETYNSRGYLGIDSDTVIESNLDIHEVAQGLLKQTLQDEYDSWKMSRVDYIVDILDDDSVVPTWVEQFFLQGTTEFYTTIEVTNSCWIVTKGEEEWITILQENDLGFTSEAVEVASPVVDDIDWNENEVVDDFESLTGQDPYANGLWEPGFNPGKVLVEAGVIK
jgi:hypothetical protein